MPSTYAHDTFARRVMDQLPESLAEICHSHETQFLVGSQGPDFLYFYHPTVKNRYTETGVLIHNCCLSRFLSPVLPILELYGTDSMEYAYMLGFLCHFALDSHCHPYISSTAKELSFPHIMMETEFDRFLMEKNGEKAMTYPLYEILPEDQTTVRCMHHIYPDVPEDVILTCLKTYRHYRKLWITPNKADYMAKKLFFKARMKRSGYFCNFLMKEQPHPLAETTNPVLNNLYEEAIELAVSFITSFHESFTEHKGLDQRFDRNFK